MRITDLIHEAASRPAPWSAGDNIPWNEPAFSERMLREHLTPEHDLASRRGATVDRHVAWIHEHVLQGQRARILDLCCGPGLYGLRLSQRGHAYHGIDYSPASIIYANRECVGGDSCTYAEGDVRTAEYGEGYTLAMLVYGELNVFSPCDAAAILRKAHAALEPGGLLLLEPHTFAGVKGIGESGGGWDAHESGLFSERPHLCLRQGHWDEDTRTSTMRFFVIDAETGEVTRHAASYQAYTGDEYRKLLADNGFKTVSSFRTLAGDVEPNQPTLLAILACKAR